MNKKKCELKLKTEVIKKLKTVYDPEIPVNIYDLGLIYEIKISSDDIATIIMTLTAPNCPMVDSIIKEMKEKIAELNEIKDINIEIVFDPPWTMEMMSEEAKLEFGFL